MLKIFLDANIFFAAARSPKGGSGFVLELGKKKRFQVVTVVHALLEAERNIKTKLGDFYLVRHYRNLLELNPKIQSLDSISLREVLKFQEILPKQDIPILIGAILNNSDFLITLDKKHLLDNQKLKNLNLPFKILNPGDFLTKHI